MEGIGILAVKDRVYAKTEFVEGFGVIEYIAQGELLPIQMEMDNADENGHKTFRFTLEEISIMEPTKEEPAATLDGEYIAEVKYTSGGFRKGDRHIIGPAKDPRLVSYYNVYFMDHQIMATIKRDIFNIIKPYEEPKKDIFIETHLKPVLAVLDGGRINISTTDKPREIERETKELEPVLKASEQLSMFDFI